MFFLLFTSNSCWVHVVVISLICTHGDKLEKDMTRIYQVKETDIASEEEIHSRQ